ncbi:hypothetical protein swp_4487 [Shewanella piezotolerans WP3]|uniref:Lipoprotein n=1 Tax=Shewanella piezotolerans (strain WP3 / JCM 13877) TaxID=225849 RepID=B8CUD8_SHEPW|nr:hypothetical protein [Shewanella piezotolerans]ACJ31130.1 hypothetical protein swp_4487 [Shewanella piezotolerans WP3]
MRNYIMAVICIIGISGCATIPPEAPNLSSELGNRISALENANITLLNRYFDQKRIEVDRFIQDVWLPEFANEFFQKPFISDAWNTVVTENDKQQRLTFLLKTGPKLQEMINDKRIELIQPLDELERRIERNIKAEYGQARGINNSITSFLLSASKVSENRDRYLEMMGVSNDKLTTLIDRTDNAVSDLLKTGHKVDDKVNSAKKYLNKIKDIKESIE